MQSSLPGEWGRCLYQMSVTNHISYTYEKIKGRYNDANFVHNKRTKEMLDDVKLRVTKNVIYKLVSPVN